MFGIGGQELLVILVVALLVLGPKKLPDVARTLGKTLGEFRRVSTEFQRTLNTEIALEETRKPSGQKDEAQENSPAAASVQAATGSSSTDSGKVAPASAQDEAEAKKEA